MSRLLSDIETGRITPDGTLDPPTIHCIVNLDLDTNVIRRYHNWPDKAASEGNLKEGIKALEEASVVYGHNFLGFDLPTLRELGGAKLEYDKIIDTEVLSRCAYPFLKDHSMKGWGRRWKQPKVEHEDWSKFTPEMLHRCVEDVKLNHRMLRTFEKRMIEQEWPLEALRLELDSQYILHQQRKNGFPFDEEAAFNLLDKLEKELRPLEEKLGKLFPPKKCVRRVEVKAKKDGSPSRVGLKSWLDSGLDLSTVEAGDILEAPYEVPFNPNSGKQIIERLTEKGWIPTEFTDHKTNPQAKTGYEQLELIRGIEGTEELTKYVTKNYIRTVINSPRAGWLKCVREDTGRIHGRTVHIGAQSHRCAHSQPNLGNIPRRGEGSVCRSLFISGDNRTLVGCDASGIQMRLLCHLIGDPNYTKEVLEGDIHSLHAIALGLCPEDVERDSEGKVPGEFRDPAKTYIYAWLLNAGVGKVAAILNCTQAEARRKMENFDSRIPGLTKAKEGLRLMATRLGYVRGLDGRRCYVRKPYDALAYWLQMNESIAMKRTMVKVNRDYLGVLV